MNPQASILNVVSTFLERLKVQNIPLDSVYLFGSQAKGTSHPLSDIDLALVSKSFTGVPFYDSLKINPDVISTSVNLEVHPFRPEDFTRDDPFVDEIVRTGIKIL